MIALYIKKERLSYMSYPNITEENHLIDHVDRISLPTGTLRSRKNYKALTTRDRALFMPRKNEGNLPSVGLFAKENSRAESGQFVCRIKRVYYLRRPGRKGVVACTYLEKRNRIMQGKLITGINEMARVRSFGDYVLEQQSGIRL